MSLFYADKPKSQSDLAIRIWFDKMDDVLKAKGDYEYEIPDDELERLRTEAEEEAARQWNATPPQSNAA